MELEGCWELQSNLPPPPSKTQERCGTMGRVGPFFRKEKAMKNRRNLYQGCKLIQHTGAPVVTRCNSVGFPQVAPTYIGHRPVFEPGTFSILQTHEQGRINAVVN
uniref:Uncharacterized protein n=1 Tax=Gopherus agassizii TaxID=38772 RepID=A0A452IA36_9SAUR